jgi:D-alanyl-D-alanine carboxypeptidase/D-alanyl-D-alanine-endopeptidase (penicillin-binding protein 4)
VYAVGGLDAGSPVVVDGRGEGRGQLGAVVPASTTKLLTATAALATLGPDHTFTTRVVASPNARRVVLVGGGDPYLETGKALTPEPQYPSRADVTSLARLTAHALRERGVRRVSLGFDDGLFTGPVASPHWRKDYLPDQVVAPITALAVDGGRPPWGYGRVSDPPAYAAQVFAAGLRREGIAVRPTLDRRAAPTGGAELASVTSAPLAEIVEHMLDVSDNEAAEVLAHHVGLAAEGEGSFAAARRGVAASLAELGVDLSDDEVYDGSGLSRRSRVRITTLLEVLRVAASPSHPELRPVVTGLPVAGFTGSLELRFDRGDSAGRGLVRAKTGTLTGVSGLAGLVTDAGGGTLVFAAVADRVAEVDTLGARDALDGLAAALAACRCARP